jgi:uncharacterized membrane protein SpoIIM required for sporulation
MVLESLIDPKIAEKKPYITFFLGLFYSSFAILIARYILPDYASISFVFFVTLLFLPLFYNTMFYEESKDLDDSADEATLLRQHSKAAVFFIFLFLGLTISFSVWYVVLSENSFMGMDSTLLFSSQINTINQINGKATEQGLKPVFSLFGLIFGNNIKVMIFCILFSFIFGAGAIFILTWNSSVIGAALGRYIVGILSAGTAATFLTAPACGIIRYLIHGIPEILAYFIAGLAGGIISAALINHDFGTSKFEKIMVDASFLIIIAVIIIFVAAIMEITLTPLIMCRL